MGGNRILAIAVAAFVLALAGSVEAMQPPGPECTDEAQRIAQADLVITGTVASIGYGSATVEILSIQKGSSRDSAITVANAYAYQGGQGLESRPIFTQADVGSTYSMQLKSSNAGSYPYSLVCSTYGRQLIARGQGNPAEQVSDKAEFTLKLKPGWNLVSVPVANYQQIYCVRAPCYPVMPANLKSNSCPPEGTKVFVYDRENKKYVDQTQKLYEKIYPGGGFDAGKSYWIRTSADCEMSFDGTHEMTPELLAQGSGWALSAGWNNVGAPIDNVEFKKVSAVCSLNTLWRYNTAARKWEKAEVLKPGEGYFVKAAGECNLVPSEPTPSDRETIELQTLQCMGNPWELDWLKRASMESYPPKQSEEAKKIIKAYYQKLGFTVYSVDFKKIADVVCAACSCSEGYSVILTVSRADAEAYCEQDSDCVRQQTCGCDDKYVNKKYFAEVLCSYPPPACPWRLTKGACEDNKCKAVPLEAG